MRHVAIVEDDQGPELSWLDPGGLFALLGQAFYARRGDLTRTVAAGPK